MTHQDFATTIHALKLASHETPPPAPLTPSRSLASLAARERVEDLITPYLERLYEELGDELPSLSEHHRMYDGHWIVGIHAEMPRRGRHKGTACTRLEFAIDITDSGTRAVLTCYATVTDAELPTLFMQAELDANGVRALEATVEEACLAFAQAAIAATRDAT